jgi:hypothetical protein
MYITAGVRFNEPLLVHIHNHASRIRTRQLEPAVPPAGTPAWKAKHGAEFNAPLNLKPVRLRDVPPALKGNLY